jgi:hypothetical protein
MRRLYSSSFRLQQQDTQAATHQDIRCPAFQAFRKEPTCQRGYHSWRLLLLLLLLPPLLLLLLPLPLPC